VPRIRYVDALKLKHALNAAGLEPLRSEPARMLTPKELHDLKALVDSVTIRQDKCAHLTWVYPHACCPNCGTRETP
jgi:hypothetical protein